MHPIIVTESEYRKEGFAKKEPYIVVKESTKPLTLDTITSDDIFGINKEGVLEILNDPVLPKKEWTTHIFIIEKPHEIVESEYTKKYAMQSNLLADMQHILLQEALRGGKYSFKSDLIQKYTWAFQQLKLDLTTLKEIDVSSSKLGTSENVSGSAKLGTPENVGSKLGTPENVSGSAKLGTPDNVYGSAKLGTPENVSGSAKLGTPENVTKLGTPENVSSSEHRDVPKAVEGNSEFEFENPMHQRIPLPTEALEEVVLKLSDSPDMHVSSSEHRDVPKAVEGKSEFEFENPMHQRIPLPTEALEEVVLKLSEVLNEMESLKEPLKAEAEKEVEEAEEAKEEKKEAVKELLSSRRGKPTLDTFPTEAMDEVVMKLSELLKESERPETAAFPTKTEPSHDIKNAMDEVATKLSDTLNETDTFEIENPMHSIETQPMLLSSRRGKPALDMLSKEAIDEVVMKLSESLKNLPGSI